MAAKDDVLGIDLGTQCLKMVKITRKAGANPVVSHLSILEKNANDPQVGDLVRQAVDLYKLKGLQAAVCVEDPQFKIRKIELPKMPDADLKEAIRWKMRDVVEGSVDDYIIRWSGLAEGPDVDNKKITVVGYAVPKSVVDKTMTLLQKAGLKPHHIEPGVVSLGVTLEACTPSTEEWHAGIDLGVSKTNLVILGHGRFYFSRPLAGINRKLQESTPEHFNQKLAAEIQNSLDTFAVTFRIEKIARLFLAGWGAGLPDLAGYLDTNLGITTEVLNPFRDVEVPPEMEKAMAGKPYLFSQAMAMARITP